MIVSGVFDSLKYTKLKYFSQDNIILTLYRLTQYFVNDINPKKSDILYFCFMSQMPISCSAQIASCCSAHIPFFEDLNLIQKEPLAHARGSFFIQLFRSMKLSFILQMISLSCIEAMAGKHGFRSSPPTALFQIGRG